MKERTKLLLLLAAFGGAYFLPIEEPRTQRAFLEGLFLVKDYARQHVLLCLVPAFFIAGAIGQFVSQGAVMRYLGSRAPRPVAYGVASVSGSILAVCSCTVLPLFAGGRRFQDERKGTIGIYGDLCWKDFTLFARSAGVLFLKRTSGFTPGATLAYKLFTIS